MKIQKIYWVWHLQYLKPLYITISYISKQCEEQKSIPVLQYAEETFTAFTKAEHILLHFQKAQSHQNWHMEQ